MDLTKSPIPNHIGSGTKIGTIAIYLKGFSLLLFHRILDSVASNTNIIIPHALVKVIDDAIQRDGIAFARVPLRVELEMSRYGPQDPLGMLGFRVACFPDIKDMPICDECVLAVEKCLESRVQLASRQSTSYFPLQVHSVISTYWDNNTFRDTLMTLMRRLWCGFMEVVVF
jgi:hypothetical protein